MKTLKLAASCVMLSLAVVPMSAQTTPDTLYIPERSVVVTGDKNNPSNHDLVAVLYNTEELHFNDPRAPRFLFLDREGKVALGIGGYIKGTMQYDFDGAIDDGASFTTYDIPVPFDPAQRNQYYANANHSTIFLQMVGKTSCFGYFQAYLQTNFTGAGDSGYGLKLKQAYLSLGYVTAGLARSTFADGAAGVPTIDDEGPSGQVDAKNVLLQYKPKLTKNITAAISVEMPQADYTVTDGVCRSIKQRVPDIPVFVQYAWGKGSHVRLSGLLRNLSYRDLVSQKNRFATGWAVQLSGLVDFAPGMTFFYQGAYGKGYAHYVNDLSDAGVDLIPDGTTGRMKTPATLALVGGLKYQPTSKLFVSASYSQSRLYDQGGMGPEAYRYGQYVVANAFYNIIPELRIGLEYLHGTRTDINHDSGHANRLTGMLQFSF